MSFHLILANSRLLCTTQDKGEFVVLNNFSLIFIILQLKSGRETDSVDENKNARNVIIICRRQL